MGDGVHMCLLPCSPPGERRKMIPTPQARDGGEALQGNRSENMPMEMGADNQSHIKTLLGRGWH